ncbi:MAG: hypothetical protein RLZZ584_66 [Pseudomonadota bacterium]
MTDATMATPAQPGPQPGGRALCAARTTGPFLPALQGSLPSRRLLRPTHSPAQP